MQSHDLARALLARRNNDIQFVVEVAEEGYDDGDFHSTEMADDRQRVRDGGTVPDVISYDSEHDFIVIKLGTIFLGDPEVGGVTNQ